METLKELVVPSNFCLLLVAIGAAAYLRSSTRRFSRWLLGGAGLLLVTLSSGWIASALLSPLEYSSLPASLRKDDPPANAIVVLAAYGTEEPEMPLSSWLNGSALFRVVESIHLRERCAACRVFVTGGSPTVEVMAKMLVSLGVPEDKLVLDTGSANTSESARNLADRVRGGPFYLVTSAGHMPRALLVFRRQGLDPLPAPTDYQLPREFTRAHLLPSPLGLHYSDLAVHEYLGILWYRLRGRL